MPNYDDMPFKNSQAGRSDRNVGDYDKLKAGREALTKAYASQTGGNAPKGGTKRAAEYKAKLSSFDKAMSKSDKTRFRSDFPAATNEDQLNKRYNK